jgi:hypothetical protein
MCVVRAAAILLVSLPLVAAVPTVAQPVPPRGAVGGPAGAGVVRGGGSAGVGFNPKHKEDQLLAIKDQLEVGDEQWKALSPKVDRVLAAKINMSTGAGMNWQSANNAKPSFSASAAKSDTPAGKAMQEVRDAVANKDAPDEELARKMAEVRKARQKARLEYDAAQKALSDAITPRQQAVLMTLGVVE